MKVEPENAFLAHHSLQIPERQKVDHNVYESETMNDAQKIEEKNNLASCWMHTHSAKQPSYN